MITINSSETTDEAATTSTKAERNAAFLEKLDRGLAQVRAGQGIVKTMEELEAMEATAKIK